MDLKPPAPIAAVLITLCLAGCSSQETEPLAETQSAAQSIAPASIRDVSIAEADALISASGDVTVLDVRTPGEFAEGHIEGAVNLDVKGDDFIEQLAKLDPAKTYVIHCKSGARSARALEAMKEQGFADIAHMNEGFDAWQAAGMSIAR